MDNFLHGKNENDYLIDSILFNTNWKFLSSGFESLKYVADKWREIAVVLCWLLLHHKVILQYGFLTIQVLVSNVKFHEWQVHSIIGLNIPCLEEMWHIWTKTLTVIQETCLLTSISTLLCFRKTISLSYLACSVKWSSKSMSSSLGYLLRHKSCKSSVNNGWNMKWK